ncbi:MAG: heterodisulfide reductase-related iron-sulfur binding cluster [Steroidobacteraceae bacterium]|jgi:Fe-S oxidoreductase|nr:heterodisulfide reductase-related iron-sulfur binding cluster [Steroidobacteraceae bacterium]
MYDIGAVNYAILAVLLCAAGAAVVLGLRDILRRISPERSPLADVASFKELLGRVNWPSFLSRGLLLSRLFKRPAIGVAHALLFFGALFEIFGHGLYGLSFVGVPVYSGAFGFIVMELGREIAGVAMLLGVLYMLMVRAAPPERLTAGKARRGFVAMELLLLFIIAAGFVTEAMRLALPEFAGAGEFLGRVIADRVARLGVNLSDHSYLTVFWLHALLGLAFIVLITRTPMSHMLLGPINTAMAKRRSGVTLTPIDFEVDEPLLGAEKLADLPFKNRFDFDACLWCGRCHEVCPATQTGKPLSPKKIMVACAEYQQQGRTDDASLIDALGMDALFSCTTCAACVEECPVTNNPAEAIVHFRRQYVMGRSEMPEVMATANRNLESRRHPFAGASANRDDWRRDLDVPFFEPGKTEYLLWIGCSIAFEERAQQIARAMIRILDAAGLSWGILEESRCTGDPAKMMGNELLFVELAQANIEDFQQAKVQKVVTMCAHCFNSFDRYYPELGATWETIPHSVLIDRLIRDGKLNVRRDAAQKITFHDPCYLARHNDIMDEPRSVLAAVGELVEMPRNRKSSFCCGAGGGAYWAREGGTARISDVRVSEAFDTGADKVATSCSFCMLMLSSSASKHTEQRKVFDVAELVVEALAEQNPAASDSPAQEPRLN